MLSPSTEYCSLAECRRIDTFSQDSGKNQGLSGACSKIKNLNDLGPTDYCLLATFGHYYFILDEVGNTECDEEFKKKCTVYLPGTADEQASEQDKREIV